MRPLRSEILGYLSDQARALFNKMLTVLYRIADFFMDPGYEKESAFSAEYLLEAIAL